MKPFVERLLTWSFCDVIQDDFIETVEFFKKWLPTHTCRSDVSLKEKIDIYENSIFVLVQNNTNIDEIISAGAIPVLVKSKEVPLYIYAETAEQAVKNCTLLLKNPKVLQKLQDSLPTFTFTSKSYDSVHW